MAFILKPSASIEILLAFILIPSVVVGLSLSRQVHGEVDAGAGLGVWPCASPTTGEAQQASVGCAGKPKPASPFGRRAFNNVLLLWQVQEFRAGSCMLSVMKRSM